MNQPIWRKATASDPNGQCVELADLGGDAVVVRDSKDPEGGMLTLTRSQVAALVAGVKAGEFDDFA